MRILRENIVPKITFSVDQGKTIKKRATSVGIEDTADYDSAKEITEGTLVVIDSIDDYFVRKATTDDVPIGVALYPPTSYIDQDYDEVAVLVYGEFYVLPLKSTNAAITPGDPIKLGLDGADKGTATTGEFISVQGMTASDSKEFIEVIKPLLDKKL